MVKDRWDERVIDDKEWSEMQEQSRTIWEATHCDRCGRVFSPDGARTYSPKTNEVYCKRCKA